MGILGWHDPASKPEVVSDVPDYSFGLLLHSQTKAWCIATSTTTVVLVLHAYRGNL